MIWVVLDSNVIVSGLAFGGNPRQILDKVEAGEVALAWSARIRHEVESVLSAKFRRSEHEVRAVCGLVWAAGREVAPTGIPATCDDPDDDQILACAVAAGVEMIITGDDDLLRLREYRGIRILSPAAFLAGDIPR